MRAGVELDRMAAEKVMEWKIHPVSGNWVGAGPNVGTSRPCVHALNWMPSSNIAHAWEVVEMAVKGGRVVRINNDEHGANCLIFSAGGDIIARESAETAPLAICKAALAALRATEGKG